MKNGERGEPACERAIAVIRPTQSGQWIVNIYGVLSGKRRLAIKAHGSLGYVERVSALYCGSSPVETPDHDPGETSLESHSRLKTASFLEEAPAAANDSA